MYSSVFNHDPQKESTVLYDIATVTEIEDMKLSLPLQPGYAQGPCEVSQPDHTKGPTCDNVIKAGYVGANTKYILNLVR